MANNATNQPGNTRGRHGGFTLVELMIAVGVLGVGLTMAAALFPTAIRETVMSTDDVIGTMICNNATAIIEARLRHSTWPAPPAWAQSPADLCDLTAQIGPKDTLYAPLLTDPDPNRVGKSRYGFMLLGKKMFSGPGKENDNNKNDYLFVIIAYRKTLATNTMVAACGDAPSTLWSIAGTYSGTTLTAPATAITKFQPGGVVVTVREDPIPDAITSLTLPAAGNYARILSKWGANNVTLDRAPYAAAGATPYTAAYVVYEVDPGGNIVGTVSPVIAVMSIRTSLRP